MYDIEKLKPLAEALPSPYKENALDLLERMGTVIEGIGDRPIEWRPSMLKIVQATTDRSKLPKGVGPGSLLMGEEVVEAPLKFIPMRLNVVRQYWDPDLNNNRMLCQSPDAKMGFGGMECRNCPKSQWVEGEGSECSKVYQLLSISEDLREVFTTNFSKTNYKVGAEFESTLRKAGVDPYLRIYSMETETSTKSKNVEMYKINVLPANERRTPPELVAFLKALFDQITQSRKAMITLFYEAAQQRREKSQAAIGHDSGADVELEVPSLESNGKTSSQNTEDAVVVASDTPKHEV